MSKKNMFSDSLQPLTSIGIRIKTQLFMSAIIKDALERPTFYVIETPCAVTQVKKVWYLWCI